MPFAACTRCKSLKVRCIKPEGKDCVRCARAGEPCIKGPPSRQGKRRWSSVDEAELHVGVDSDGIKISARGATSYGTPSGIPTANTTLEVYPCPYDDDDDTEAVPSPSMQMVTPLAAGESSNAPFASAYPMSVPVPIDHLLSVGVVGSDETSLILQGMCANRATAPPRTALFWVLRHLAAHATAMRSNAHFERALHLATTCGISFADVVLGLEAREMAKPGAAFWQRITPCFGQLAAKQTGAYILAKSCFPIAAGKAGYIANDLFQTNVSTIARLEAASRVNKHEEQGIWAEFVHPDDTQAIPIALGHLVASALPAAMEGKCQQTTAVVRLAITDPLTGATYYQPCNTMVHLSYIAGHATVGCVFSPIAQPVSRSVAMPSYAAAAAAPPPPVLEIDAVGKVGPFSKSNSGGSGEQYQVNRHDCIGGAAAAASAGGSASAFSNSTSTSPEPTDSPYLASGADDDDSTADLNLIDLGILFA